jgi:hypothetical protein
VFDNLVGPSAILLQRSGKRGPAPCVEGEMLRAFGLLVAVAVALLVWAVRPSESRSLKPAESVPAPAPGPAPTTHRRWTDRPEPRLPDLPPADDTDLVDPPESAEPAVELAEPDPPELPEPPPEEEVMTEAEPEPEPEPEPAYVPTAADEELLARSIRFFDQFVSAVESNAGDCDRMADALSEVLSSNRDLIAEGKAMADQLGRSRWFAGQMEARAADGVERMMTPLQGCMSNERMMKAMSSLVQ